MSATVDDTLARLLLAAKRDASLRDQILFLARLPQRPREAMINTAIHEMELRGESRQDRAAFALLATPEGANAAKAVLM